ncbi:MAG: hypothetical protein V3V47_05195, partial [Desulfobacteria bacterium]
PWICGILDFCNVRVWLNIQEGGTMSDKEKFLNFFNEVGIKSTNIQPEDVLLEMEEDVAWETALSVGQLWFLFGKDDEYLGLLNDETMEFEPRGK